MENSEIAKIFQEIAEFLELKQENPFKIRAYQKAAQNIEALSQDLADLYINEGIKGLQELPGIGKELSEKIESFIKTGKIDTYEKLRREFPKGFIELLNVPSLGPKTAMLLFRKFKIDSVAKLEKLAKAGKLQGIPGFGAKKEENLLKGIALKKKVKGRFLLSEALAYAEPIVSELKNFKEVDQLLPAGSLRRRQETIGDLDFLVTSKKPEKVMDAFTSLPQVERTLAKGETKASVVLKNGMQADLRVVPNKSFGAAAHYFTGCKAHNIYIRQLAQKKGWKVSEYGIFNAAGRQIGGTTEKEMFSKFGLQFIPPELREMRGEFAAAAKHRIPRLIELSDIRGDLQMHSNHSDGSSTIEEMAAAAKQLGYEYIAITDHTRSTRVAGGQTEKEFLKELGEIDRINKRLKGFRVLKGVEVDILPDGTLDFSDKVLKQAEVVIAAIHSNFKMEKSKMTKRIIKALENKYVNILAHPTGRLIGKRGPYEVDIEAVLQAAKRTGTVLEINAYPERLDLSDIHALRAREIGVDLAIDTDSHSPIQLKSMKYGVMTARRGWLEKKSVINTLPTGKLLKLLMRKR
ncbi:MAG: DNA polymerase/3'-5' exonuclease PolX [Candidatus Margulisbacteria bacterium]|nr:DNA polymerase/3'-5' exonuclease PolX [Candidatus Margulisiibacteriota bacterium]MBU1617608.1 DNA polymerase/3'-5' exonuclease PolX [Candidatus Margulisiibacteriota bacterium]MBU1866879.1 DNA polymerase/3'-5' exonuclease PolX [Candidatus Margulisiibacteriota bacterium]